MDNQEQRRTGPPWHREHGRYRELPASAAETELLGLRERKKLATREALGAAALRLALERGFEHLRVEDIAEAAGVSPRTFNNYFSSREEAICALRNHQVRRYAAALRARPAGEPLIDALITVVTEQQPREPSREVARLIQTTPSVSAEFIRGAADAQIPLVEAIAERTGTQPEDLLPNVVTAAVFGAQRIAMHRWACTDDPRPYPALLRDALNQLRALTEPIQATAGEAASAAVSTASGP